MVLISAVWTLHAILQPRAVQEHQNTPVPSKQPLKAALHAMSNVEVQLRDGKKKSKKLSKLKKHKDWMDGEVQQICLNREE